MPSAAISRRALGAGSSSSSGTRIRVPSASAGVTVVMSNRAGEGVSGVVVGCVMGSFQGGS
jgi:hypothetical protein